MLSVLAAGLVAAVTARQLGPAGRGTLVVLLMLAQLGVFISGLGVNISGRVELAAPENPVQFTAYLGLSLALATAQAVLCGAIGLTLLPLAGIRLGLVDLGLFAFLGAVFLMQLLLVDALNAFGSTVQAAVVEAVAFTLQLAMVVGLAAAGASALRLFVLVFILAGVFQIIAALAYLRRRSIPLGVKYRPDDWRRLVRKGLPAIGTELSQVLTFRIDRYLVAIFLNPAAVGIYSVAATATEVLRVAPLALSQSIFYRIASGSASVDDFRGARRACVGLTVGLAGVLFLTAPLAVRIAFGMEFAPAVIPLRILLLAELGMTIFYLNGASLLGLGRLGAGSVACLVGLLVVVVADLLLIPTYQLAGAAWASVLAYSVMGIMAYLLLVRTKGQDAASRQLLTQ
ncbi:MAG: polysaccharide biosynthesis C-terminal domain-containing protein [Acidimicrobiales bacterium]